MKQCDSAGSRWTKQEDSLLGTMSDEKLARKFRRSIEAVAARRHVLRVSLRRKWNSGEDKLLGTRPDLEIARLTGRMTANVAQRRRKLGIPEYQDLNFEKKLASLTDQQVARLLRKSHQLRRTVPNHGKRPLLRWTPKEEELLGKWPDERLARFLGRTTKAVMGRRWKRGIFLAQPGRRWTPEEVKLLDPALIKGQAVKWTAELARKLGRSVVSVTGKRKAVYGPTTNVRPWTKRELRMLGTRPDSEIAAAIGRKCGTVQVRRGELGIPSFRERNQFKWTPARDRLLGKQTDAELAVEWKIGRENIKARRQKLGIAPMIYRLWTAEQESLIGTMPDKDVASRIGRSVKSVVHRRIALKMYKRINSTKLMQSQKAKNDKRK